MPTKSYSFSTRFTPVSVRHVLSLSEGDDHLILDAGAEEIHISLENAVLLVSMLREQVRFANSLHRNRRNQKRGVPLLREVSLSGQ